MKRLTIIFILIVNLQSSNLPNNQIKTYKAKFLQTIKNPSGKIINYNGLVYIKQSEQADEKSPVNKMLWQYKKPIEKYVYMNNLNIIVDEPELEQATYTQLSDEINLIDFLNNPDLVDDKYKLTFNEELLTKIQYSDEMENNITIKFTNIKLNSDIDDKLFHFIAPMDYDIIKK